MKKSYDTTFKVKVVVSTTQSLYGGLYDEVQTLASAQTQADRMIEDYIVTYSMPRRVDEHLDYYEALSQQIAAILYCHSIAVRSETTDATLEKKDK